MSAKLTMQYHDAVYPVELHLPNLCMADSYLASITHVYCGPILSVYSLNVYFSTYPNLHCGETLASLLLVSRHLIGPPCT